MVQKESGVLSCNLNTPLTWTMNNCRNHTAKSVKNFDNKRLPRAYNQTFKNLGETQGWMATPTDAKSLILSSPLSWKLWMTCILTCDKPRYSHSSLQVLVWPLSTLTRLTTWAICGSGAGWSFIAACLSWKRSQVCSRAGTILIWSTISKRISFLLIKIIDQ